MSISISTWGTNPAGEPISLFTLAHASGFTATITNLGGTIVSLHAPDRDGKFEDVVLGFNDLAGYLGVNPYFGCIIGRFGNRIAGGKFSIDGNDFSVNTNEAPSGIECSLHGGKIGFDKKIWAATSSETDGVPKLTLTYTSPAGEEGYPGELQAKVVYTVNEDSIAIEYFATATEATPYNPTNHSYFNLEGTKSASIEGHHLTLNASHFTPVGPDLIPTGVIAPVEDTAFDFRTAKPIGQDINQADQQLITAGGYDHNYVIDRTADGLALAATVFEPKTGREMEVWTTEPGIQLYSGNFLDGTLTSKSGGTYAKRSGFCLETQHFPDSPNKPEFPSTILRPGVEFFSRTDYRFRAK